MYHFCYDNRAIQFSAKQERTDAGWDVTLHSSVTNHERIKFAYIRARSNGVLPVLVLKLTSEFAFVTKYCTTSNLPFLKWHEQRHTMSCSHHNDYYIILLSTLLLRLGLYNTGVIAHMILSAVRLHGYKLIKSIIFAILRYDNYIITGNGIESALGYSRSI